MLKIKSDTEKHLSFDLEVSGSQNVPDVRLVMETKESDFQFLFPAKIENGVAKIVIPELNQFMEMLREKDVSVKLETILDGHYSVIWEDNSVLIEEPVKVTAKNPILKEKDTTDKQTIKVKNVSEKDEKEDDNKVTKPSYDDDKDKEQEYDIDPSDQTTDKNDADNVDEKCKKKNEKDDDKYDISPDDETTGEKKSPKKKKTIKEMFETV